MISKIAEYDVIVIGSGIGGLTAATRLAQNNQRVLVIEASSDFGGYIRPINIGEYSFDMGLHYLGKLGQGELFREILDKLGLENLEFVEGNAVDLPFEKGIFDLVLNIESSHCYMIRFINFTTSY